MCPPLGFHIVVVAANLNGWIIVRADVKAAYMKTGKAARDVYVRPPREPKYRRHYWLLFTAIYGIVNWNAKLQTQAYELILSLGLSSVTVVAQIFHLNKDRKVVLLVAKVDDLLITGVKSYVEEFLEKFTKKFEFGSVVRGPDVLQFYGLTSRVKIFQHPLMLMTS